MNTQSINQSVFLPAFLDRHRILNVQQVAELLGFSVMHTRRLYRSGRIPKPLMIGGRKFGWSAAVILDLIASREAA